MAAEVVVAQAHANLLSLPWLQTAAAVLLTIVSGVGGTLVRKTAAIYSGEPFHTEWEAARDIAVSVCIGVSGYFIGSAMRITSDVLAAGLVIAGFGGTKVLGAAVDKLLDMLQKDKA